VKLYLKCTKAAFLSVMQTIVNKQKIN